MMTKKERVLAAFQGKPVDRVPVCVWKHVPSELWDDDDAFAKCQLDYYKATDVDFMKLSGDKYFGWPDPGRYEACTGAPRPAGCDRGGRRAFP